MTAPELIVVQIIPSGNQTRSNVEMLINISFPNFIWERTASSFASSQIKLTEMICD